MGILQGWLKKENRMKKLNLGCGKDTREGFINLDFRENQGVDIVCDIKDGLPFKNGELDFIFAQDIIEHFPLDYTDTLIKELYRVLKKGGEIEAQVPNFELNYKEYKEGIARKLFKEQSNCHRFSQCVFGKQDYEGNYHYQLFDKDRLRSIFETNGFEVVKEWEYGRGLNIIARKK